MTLTSTLTSRSRQVRSGLVEVILVCQVKVKVGKVWSGQRQGQVRSSRIHTGVYATANCQNRRPRPVGPPSAAGSPRASRWRAAAEVLLKK